MLLANNLDRDCLVGLVTSALGSDLATVVKPLHGRSLSSEQAARCLIALRGTDFLADREIRSALVDYGRSEQVDKAFFYSQIYEMSDSLVDDQNVDRRQTVATKTWHPGSTWARQFCKAFDLPSELSGFAEEPVQQQIERGDPYIRLSELHDFQREISEKIVSLMRSQPDGRALIALPTGAGKTRLMVDTLLGQPDIMLGRKKIVWVAQHNELCEQAVQCFLQVWRSRENPENRQLIVQRVWRSLSDVIDWRADVIIGTPESLTDRLRESTDDERRTVAAVVVDEAHFVGGEDYAKLFGLLSASVILGITATPGSSTKAKTRTLHMRFLENLILADSLGNEPVAVLTERKFLSEVEVEIVHTPATISSKDLAETEAGFTDVSHSSLMALGSNTERNAAIIERLLSVPENSRVLCFAPSVRASRAIASALAIFGRSAASVDSENDYRHRDKAVADFKDGRLQFLINYGVLATGFDAPKVDYLVLARPTTSPVLFEQMLGRGLRGPRNGGTERCRIIHFQDHFTSFGGIIIMSYARFVEWSSR